MFAQTGFIGIIPGTGAHLNNCRAHGGVNHNACQAGTAIVKRAHKIPGFKPAHIGILRVHVQWFASSNFTGLADRTMIELGV